MKMFRVPACVIKGIAILMNTDCANLKSVYNYCKNSALLI